MPRVGQQIALFADPQEQVAAGQKLCRCGHTQGWHSGMANKCLQIRSIAPADLRECPCVEFEATK